MRRRALIAAAACAVPSLVRAQTAGFAAAIAYSGEHGGAALLIARHGRVLAEDYPGGFDANAAWPLGAGSRVIAILLAAALVDDGLMGLDEPVSFTLGDWGAHPLKSLITVRMLLNGTSGVVFAGAEPTLANAIAAEPTTGPGGRYIEDPAPYVILSEIARRKLFNTRRAEDIATYLTRRIFDPLDCRPVIWTRWPDGTPRLDDGLDLTARGFAQLGELIRRDGVWRAQQLADAATLREARTGSFTEARVGMGLYLAAAAESAPPLPIDSDLWRMTPPAPNDLAMAAGLGGQRLYIIPSRNLVIARLSRSPEVRDWSDARFLGLALQNA